MSPAALPIAPALLALWLSACGGKDDAKAGGDWPSFEAPARPAEKRPPLPAACSLVTQEQVNELLGSEAGVMGDDPENCAFMSMPGVGKVLMFMVQIQQAGSEREAKEIFSGIVGMQGNLAGIVNDMAGERTRKSGQEIDGLGDEAWLSGATYGASAEEMVGGKAGKRVVDGAALTVRKGTRILTLNVTGSVRADGLGARMETLARGAVPQL